MRQYPVNDDEQQLSFDLAETITIDTSYTNDTGSEYTFNLGAGTLSTGIHTSELSWDFGNKIDPDRVEKMCEEYPALKKAWDNFYSIYRMVDQDYKDNYEVDDEAPF
jgi:hypothetical protein